MGHTVRFQSTPPRVLFQNLAIAPIGRSEESSGVLPAPQHNVVVVGNPESRSTDLLIEITVQHSEG